MNDKPTTKKRLLLVDDDRMLLESMGSWLGSIGYEVSLADTCVAAYKCCENQLFDFALVDLRLPDGDGFSVLNYFKKHQPATQVIMISGYANGDTGVEAVRAGAFDLLTKPLIDQELEMTLRKAYEQRNVMEENKNLRAQLDNRYSFNSIIANDHRMVRIFDIIESIADTRATVLVTGESGTGKSMIARAIHKRSSRADKPFVEVACGALPENLLESELFGHVEGAFTGATGNKVGKFQQAHGGTIFLDEIGTASPSFQVKLLRVLQELEFEAVGGTETVKVDTRVILATNENLEQAVVEGRFRQDLFYRINVINLELPALAQRPDDIPAMADFFLKNISQETGRDMEGLSDAAIEALSGYAWPGNVRELQNVIERAVLLTKNPQIGLNDLPSHIANSTRKTTTTTPSGSSRRMTLKEALEEPERQIIADALRRYNGNRNVTADALGINRTTLYKKMKKLGLEDKPTFH